MKVEILKVKDGIIEPLDMPACMCGCGGGGGGPPIFLGNCACSACVHW